MATRGPERTDVCCVRSRVLLSPPFGLAPRWQKRRPRAQASAHRAIGKLGLGDESIETRGGAPRALTTRTQWRHQGGVYQRWMRKRRQDSASRLQKRQVWCTRGTLVHSSGKKLAERSVASHLPRLPKADHKIIIRPKEGLTLTELSAPIIGGAVRMAAGTPWQKGREEDRIVVNDKQGTLISQHSNGDDAKKMLGLKVIKLDGKEYEVTAYMAAPESCRKGVVRGLDPRLSERELELAFSYEENRPILGVRRMGNSTSVIITFVDDYVPRWMICFGTPMNPHAKCRGCGATSPSKDHECTPTYRLCGKDHVTGDKRCKELFPTPYIMNKRQWEMKLEEEAREQEERRKAEAETQRHSRTDGGQDRSRRKSKHRSGSRGRSESFP
ncbi:hypothetical protein HPB52_001373 [Rhipicephalus sanguineus]|uniref:Uncharacterized protein n=1 Tax=Rhipicephalus sanguineus TaxID=34632 RepID=A0A9D4SVG0_RHISA|nr:hypothetical protein HPB52_001373 [Rhipicephalus sanguineus]